MKIIVDTPEALARFAAERYVTLLNKKPDAVIGTGGAAGTLSGASEAVRGKEAFLRQGDLLQSG